jgi:eukaryotic-like serine/threonine-protein kinase
LREPGPGTRLGQYRLVAPIGAGGMGRVWAALDEAAPALRLVAIKVALEGEGSDEKYWSALTDEASVAARIAHPNVCSTYELGVEKGVHFLVMEWSDGASLRDLLDALPGQRLSPQLAAQVGASVAAGLHAAHELCDESGQSLGVVHRDVSPQNVLISMRANIRLADFGVAKARGQIRRATETGELKGKLSYMAPEQISSKVVDRRADVFALACVVYEAALGVRAFHGADALSTMYLLLEEPVVSPREIDAAFPEGLQAILLKAMAKDADARHQTADELREALLGYLRAERHLVSDGALAEVLETSLGGVLAARNRSLRASAELLRRGEQLPSQVEELNSSPGSTTPGGVEKSLGRRSATTIRTAAPLSSWALVALAGGLVAIAALAGVAYSSRKHPPAAAPAAAPPAAPAANAAAADVTNEPAAMPTAVETTEPAASASAAPLAESERRPRLRTTPKPPSAVKPGAPATPSAQPVASPFELPPRGRAPLRPPRVIDQANPFAKR